MFTNGPNDDNILCFTLSFSVYLIALSSSLFQAILSIFLYILCQFESMELKAKYCEGHIITR